LSDCCYEEQRDISSCCRAMEIYKMLDSYQQNYPTTVITASN